MSSRIPGAIAKTVPAAGLITGGFGTRKPVILGVGDVKVLVEDEKIIRGITAGGTDVLSGALFDATSVVKIGNSPGSTDWTEVTHYTVDLGNNQIDWASGNDVPGASTIVVYDTVQTGDTSAPYTTFTGASTELSATDGYYVSGSATVTNTDSSNYGLSRTISGYTGATKEFVTASWPNALNVADTVVVTLEPDEPAAGQEYYVTYYKTLSNFSITEYTAEDDIRAAHGGNELSNSTSDVISPNKLTIGSLVALRNGAQSVLVGQLDNTSWGNKYSPTESEFNASLNTILEELKTQLDFKLFIVPMSTWDSAANNVWNHSKLQSAPENKGERVCVRGFSRGTAASAIKTAATAYGSTRMIAVAPPETRFSDLLDAEFGGELAAAAIAGKRCTFERVAQSITGEELANVTIESTYATPIIRDLLGAGACVLDQKAGILSIIHDKSTNVSTADTEENAIVDTGDYLRRQTRETVYNIHKGSAIDDQLLGSVASTMRGIFEREVDNTNIVDYKEIVIVQDSSEPRLVKVNAKIKYAYPLNWIDITMAAYV